MPAEKVMILKQWYVLQVRPDGTQAKILRPDLAARGAFPANWKREIPVKIPIDPKASGLRQLTPNRDGDRLGYLEMGHPDDGSTYWCNRQ